MEELAFGPPPLRSSRWLRLLLVAGAVLAVLLAVAVGWRLVRAMAPEFTLQDLDDTYAAFTTSSGGNRVSVMSRDTFGETAADVRPAGCDPLFQTTLASQFPRRALDGVLVYSIGDSTDTLSLYTFRYADVRTAREEFTQVQDAIDRCPRTSVRLGKRPPSTMQVRPVKVSTENGVRQQTAYLVEQAGDRGRFAVHVLQFGNTVTWQYRYSFTRTDYSPRPAQDLMDALVTQMRDVVAED